MNEFNFPHRVQIRWGILVFKKVSSRIKQLLTTFYGIEEQLALVPIPYTKSRGLLWKEE
jgi:hypothetical protein